MRGLVIKNTGNTYWVRTENGEEIVCQAKGSFRLKGIRSTSPIVVGDYVIIDKNPDGTAFITEIEDRKNYIVRRASNLSKQAPNAIAALAATVPATPAPIITTSVGDIPGMLPSRIPFPP